MKRESSQYHHLSTWIQGCLKAHLPPDFSVPEENKLEFYPETEISDSILKLAPEVGCCDGAKNEGSTKWGWCGGKGGKLAMTDWLRAACLSWASHEPAGAGLGEKETRAYWAASCGFQ